jgi:hypothetical protein
VLEIIMFVAMAIWGWQQGDGFLRFVFALGVPLVAAILWGTFAVPGDPSRSGKSPVRTPGIIRLLLELALFGFAAWAIYDMGYVMVSVVYGALVLIHYGLSYDRILWLVKQ